MILIYTIFIMVFTCDFEFEENKINSLFKNFKYNSDKN